MTTDHNPNNSIAQDTQKGELNEPNLTLRIVCLSDLHILTKGPVVPNGDILVIAGDMCLRDHRDELKRFNHFLAGLPHPHKIFIARP